MKRALAFMLCALPLMGHAQTLPTPTLAAGNYPAQPLTKIFGGISYSALYPGTTLDARAQACINDALHKTNGNTSGICDSSGEGGTQTIAGTIAVWDTAGDPVLWRHPASCDWQVTGSSGSANSAISYGNGTVILGNSANPRGCNITNVSGNGYIYAVLGPAPTASQGYFHVEGFNVVNNAFATGSGAVVVYQGGPDTSRMKDMKVTAYAGGITGIDVSRSCCRAGLEDIQVDMGSSGGTDLLIHSSNTPGDQVIDFSLHNVSLVHPGPGSPALKCTDTSAGHFSSFTGDLYEEVNRNANATAVANVIDGCSANISTLTLDDLAGSSATQAFSNTNAVGNNLMIGSLNMTNGFNYPATAIGDAASGKTVMTDILGRLNGYPQPSVSNSITGPFTASGNVTATGGIVLAQGNSIADNTPFLGMEMGLDNGNAPVIRFGTSATDISNDFKMQAYGGFVRYANNGSLVWQLDTQGNMGGNGTGQMTGWLVNTPKLTTPQIVPSGAAPSVATGAAAGASPTATISGFNMSGVVSVTTGTAPAASATLATVSFSSSLSVAPVGCSLTPRNAAAAALGIFATAPTQTNWTIAADAAAPAASTTYAWYYHCE